MLERIHITGKDFEKIKSLVYKHTGIQLTEDKKIMIENRLNKLLQKELHYVESLDSFLSDVERKYLTQFINVFTTNKTNFFREIHQFNYLYTELLGDMFKTGQEVKIYCSASSTGEEPWSILATCAQKAKDMGLSYARYSLLSTDIDTYILEKAKKGEYTCGDINKQGLPTWLKMEDWMTFPKGKCKNSTVPLSLQEEIVSVNQELRSRATFKQLNLMLPKYFVEDLTYDIVFCRNVLIYFSKDDQELVLEKLFRKVKIGGYLFIGHSETPYGLETKVKRLGNNIYQKIKE